MYKVKRPSETRHLTGKGRSPASRTVATFTPAVLLAPDTRHRIIISYEAEAEGKDSDDILKVILDNVAVP